jgi:hypothetical protein
MIGWHVTTPCKLNRYRATGCILPPVRFWAFEDSARSWAHKTGRTVILRFEVGTAYPLPDHRPRGHAYWTPETIDEWVRQDE